MNASDILSKLFMLVGILAVVAVLLYVIAKQIDKYKAPTQPNYPSDDYMVNIGAVCPTGWKSEYNSSDKKVRCINEYQIPQKDPNQIPQKDPNGYAVCGHSPDDGSNYNYVEFSPIKKKEWTDFVNKNITSSSIEERCKFVNSCGQNNTKYNSWIGVSNKC